MLGRGLRVGEIRLGSRTLQPHRQLLVSGRREPLGKRALDILSVLAKAGGGIVTKDELFDAVWPGVTVEENALQVHIVALRKALGREAERLQTIRGVGYRLEVDDGLGEPREASVAEPAGARQPGTQSSWPAGLWPKSRARRLALALAGLLVVLGGVWAALGAELGFRSHERVPVVVHALTASTAGDAGEVVLAKGVTDELILRLRRLPELRIATGGSDGTVPGGDFASAFVVDGTIRSDGDRLRVTARLVDPGGEIRWIQTFDRRLVDLLDVQEEIAVAIANALSVSFDVGVDSRDYGGTNNPEAYANYVQGRAQRFNHDRGVPIGHLERAVALDPGYVKALFELTIAYGLVLYEVSNEAQAEEFLAKMDAVSARAISEKPDLWLGQAARGWFELASKKFPEADARLRRVRELDEGNDPELRNVLALFSLQFGRAQLANQMMESKALIDPVFRRDPERMGTLVLNREFAEAIALYDDLATRDPMRSTTQDVASWIYWAHTLSGQSEKARQVANRIGLEPYYLQGSEFKFDAVDFPDFPEAELRQWADRKFGAGGRTALAFRAVFASHHGHQDLALRYLKLAYERPGFGFVVIWHPALTDLRKTDAFERWIADIDMVDVWRERGDWGDFCRPVSATEIACH